MKKQIVLVVVVLLVLGFGIWQVSGEQACQDGDKACQEATQIQQSKSPKSDILLSADTVLEDTQEGALLVDVREPYEFQAGHAPRATNFPLSNIEGGQYPTEEKDAKIYVYCQTGRRSALAKKELTSIGYTNIIDLGGVEDWQNMGGQLVTD